MTLPRDWSAPPADVLLADGSIAVVRPLEPGDREALLDLHENVSENTLRLRFFTTSREAGRRYVAHLFDESNEQSAALVAVIRGRIAGLATAELLAPGRAEVAFLVADQDSGRGLGSLLLEHLAALGRAHGVHRFDAEVLAENNGMLRVFRGAGFAISRRTEAGEVTVELRTDVSAAALDAADRRDWRAEARSLRPLLAPRAVAVVGVRRSGGGVGRAVLEAIGTGGYGGRLSVVHPEASAVAGVPAYPSLAALPEPPDLVVVVVPADRVAGVMEEVCAVGAGAAIIVSSGFAGAGEPVGRGLLELARAHSVRVVGPNSQGVLAHLADGTLNASFARVVPPAGGLAVATQSGGVGFTVLDLARAQGVGVHSFVSLGAKLDVSSNDLLAAWGEDERVAVAALYLESFGNALKFARTARRFASRKPLLAVVGGPTAGDGVSALFAQAGVIPCRGAADIAEAAAVLTQQPLPRGFRVGVVTNAGGMGLLAAGMAIGEGLSVPSLSPDLAAALADAAPVVGVGGPVDVGADVTSESLAAVLRTLLGSDEVDAAVVTLVPTVLADPVALREAVASVARTAGKPVVVVASDVRPEESLPGLTAFRTPLVAVVALARAMRYAAWRDVSASESPAVDASRAAAARASVASRLAGRSGAPEELPEEDAAALLAPYGVVTGPADGSSGVELTLSMVRDETFGPLLRLAVGGAAADLLHDEVHLLAPVSPADAGRALRGLRTWPLLDGVRGPERVDVEALEALVVGVGRLAVDVPEVADVELAVVAGPAGVGCPSVAVRLEPAEYVDVGFPRRLRPSD